MRKQVSAVFAILTIFLLVTTSIAVDAIGSQLMHEHGEFVPNEIIIGFDNITSHVLSDIEKSGGVVLEQILALNAVRVYVPSSREEAFVAAMKSKPRVKYVERNYIYTAVHIPNDPYWNDQWGMRIIQADSAWDIHKGKSSVIVAIIDTGIEYTHEDLSECYVPMGYDWVNDDNDPMDDVGHGTHCAGIAAAIMDNSIGVVGVAQVSLMAEKVLSRYGGTADDVAQGILHAAQAGAKVISMSFGGPASKMVGSACALAWYGFGSILVGAAGNDNISTPVYPAAYPEVIAVSATDRYDEKASYSNYGDWIELSAPGGDGEEHDWILSTYLDNQYVWKCGTSMAAPHVSGLAALVWSYNYSFTNQQVREHLRNTADDLGDLGKDPYYGYGRINAYRALDELGPPGPPDDPPECSIVDPVDGQTLSGVYRVKVNATDDKEVSLVELRINSGSWIDITGNFDGTYYFYDWDTTTVSNGSYALLARATDNASQTIYSSQVAVTVDNIPQMHVGDISMWYEKKGAWYRVYTKVPILDKNDQAIPNATVYLDTTLPDSSVQSFNGATGSDGTVTFLLKSKLTGTYTSTVTDVVKEGWAYDPAGNVETSESLTAP